MPLSYDADLKEKFDNAMSVVEAGMGSVKPVSLVYEGHACKGNTIPRLTWNIPSLPALPTIDFSIPWPPIPMPMIPGMPLPSLPGLNLPALPQLPSFNLPNIDIPSFSLPDLSLPSFGLPNINLPSFNLPTFTFPSIEFPPPLPPLPQLPDLKIPVPDISLPDLWALLPDIPDLPSWCEALRKIKKDPKYNCQLAFNLTLPDLEISMPQLAIDFGISLPDIWPDLQLKLPDLPDLPNIPNFDLGSLSVGAGVSILFPKGLHFMLPFDMITTIPMQAQAICDYWHNMVMMGQLPFLTGGTLVWPVHAAIPLMIAEMQDLAAMGMRGEINTKGFPEWCRRVEAPIKQIPMTFVTPWGMPGFAYLT